MRKLLFFVAVLSAFGYGCTSQEPEISSPNVEKATEITFKSSSSIRTLEEAAAIARDAIGMLPATDSRASSRSVNSSNVKIFYNTSPSRGLSSDTLMYIFNFDDNQGFAIVNANRNLEPLIAVTEQGNYTPGETIEDPGFADFMARAEAAASEGLVRDTTIKPVVPIDPINPELTQYKTVNDTLANWTISPNYDLKWGQNYPEGILFDNGIAGCTNTAMAIIMSYFNSPQTINLTYDNLNDILSLNWAELKQHTQSFGININDNCTTNYPSNHETLSKLVRQLGELNGSITDGQDATLTYNNRPISTFRKLGYTVTGYKDMTDNWMNDFIGGHKFLVSGKVKGQSSGHSWVIDGAKYRKVRHSEWIKEYGKDWEIIGDYSYIVTEFCHCNWGWNGDNNGWFYVDYYINPAICPIPDGAHPNNDFKFENLEYLIVKI